MMKLEASEQRAIAVGSPSADLSLPPLRPLFLLGRPLSVPSDRSVTAGPSLNQRTVMASISAGAGDTCSSADGAPTAITYPPISDAAVAAGRVTVVGFGSLLSRRSAASTFGEGVISNFRPGLIRHYRRVFAHVAPIFIERGIARVDTREMSSLSVEPCDHDQSSDQTLLVSVFEIPLSGLPAFFAREMEFRWLHVPVYTPCGSQIDPRAIDGQGLLCAAYSDEEYRTVRLGGSARAWEDAFGRWGVDKVWRDDLLPCPVYLRHVVLAAAGMDRQFGSTHDDGRMERWGDGDGDAVAAAAANDGAQSDSGESTSGVVVSESLVSLPGGRVLDSFLDGTFLGDRLTTVRSYLRRHPHLMLVQPPDSLKDRYSG